MPKPEEDLIDRLTPRPEVREKARALLRTVRSKTGPGTGYDIGDAKSGLPAICTYLASKTYARVSPPPPFSKSSHRGHIFKCLLCGRYPRCRAEGILPRTQTVYQHVEDGQGRSPFLQRQDGEWIPQQIWRRRRSDGLCRSH
jgi:hypothetical protein